MKDFVQTLQHQIDECEAARKLIEEGPLFSAVKAVAEICTELDQSASGSWLGYQARVYYAGFRKPPVGSHFSGLAGFDGSMLNETVGEWREYTDAEVRDEIFRRTPEPNHEETERVKKATSAAFRKAKMEVEAILAAIREKTDSSHLTQLQKELDEVRACTPLDEYRGLRPREVQSRDIRALEGGIVFPPHMQIQIQAHQFGSYGVGLKDLITVTQKLLLYVEKRGSLSSMPNSNALDQVLSLLDGFPDVVRWLGNRRQPRVPLTIEDEYDVQYLLNLILAAHFHDLRPEDSVPSHAGNNSRVDFLLKQEQLVIEAKMPGDSLPEKKVKTQLFDDIQAYQNHPDCKILVCFVYDPEGKITNPRGFENDLSKTYDSMTVRVVVRS